MSINTHADQAPPSAEPSEAQLRTAIYFAVGVATEGSFHANQARYGGPAANSGYTVGMMQTDLGQHNEVVDDLFTNYQHWVATQHPAWPRLKPNDFDDLKRTGAELKQQGGPRIDAAVHARLNEFLASGAGKNWTYRQDLNQIDKIMAPRKAVYQMQHTRLYQHATPEDKISLAVVAAKAFNQIEDRSFRVISKANDPRVQTVSNFMDKVHKDVYIHPYVQEGVANALHGADVAVALERAQEDNPLKPMWQHMQQAQQQLLDQAAAYGPQPLPELPAGPKYPEYITLRNVFISHAQDKDNAVGFIQALDNRQPYPSAQDLPIDTHRSLVTDGRNFVTFDQGKQSDYHNGYAYQDGGRWTDVSGQREQSRWAANPDHSHDLYLRSVDGSEQLLLHMPPAQQPSKQVEPPQHPHHPHHRQHPHQKSQAWQDGPSQDLEPDRAENVPVVQGFPLDHRDRAMFDAFRDHVPADIPDETIALIVMQAKQGGVHRYEDIRSMKIYEGNLLVVEGRIPESSSLTRLNEVAPPMEQTLAKIDVLNEQRDRVVQQNALLREHELAQARSYGGPSR